jgi:hypothetical protein
LTVYKNQDASTEIIVDNANAGASAQARFTAAAGGTAKAIFGWTPAAAFSGGDGYFFANAGVGWDFFANGSVTPSMNINGSTGNVGIGTTNASGMLQVYSEGGKSAFVVGSSTTSFIVDQRGGVAVGSQSPSYHTFVVKGRSDTYSYNTLFANSDFSFGSAGSALGIYHGAATGDTYSVIQAYDSGKISTNSLILNPSGGNVGIGTTSPWGLLSIDAPAGSPSFVVGSTTGTSFIVNKSGFVGIGTAAPGYKLDVAGTLRVTGRFYSVGTADVVTNLNADYLDGQEGSYYTGYTDSVMSTHITNYHSGGGFCPSFYSWDGEEYKEDTYILKSLVGSFFETSQSRELTTISKEGTIKGKISMEEPETAYLDSIKIRIEDSLGDEKIITELKPVWASKDLEKLLAADGDYSISQLGDEIFVEFGEAPALAESYSRTIKIVASGYYEPDFIELQNSEWADLKRELAKLFFDLDSQGNVNEFRPMVLRNLDEFGYETPENMLTVNGGAWLKGSADGIGLRVDSFGNVGIGTTTPNHQLEVIGNIAAQGFINLSTKDAKTGIEYLTDTDYQTALAKISGEVKVATYYYIGSEESIREKRLGLIAEESPSEVLSVDGKGVDLYKLSSFTLMGVKALDAKVNSQQTAIDSLASRIESLEAAVSSGALNAQADFNEALTTVSGESITLSQESVDTLTENLLAAVISGLRNLGLSIEQGMMKVKSLAADLLYTRKLAIADQPQGDDDPTIGTAMLAIGDTEVFVLNNQITDTVRIFVTPESAQPVGFTICEKNSETINIGGVYKAQGFRICISESAEQEVKFNWWLVETATNDQISMPDDQTSSQPSTSPQPSPFQEEGAEEVSVSPLASPEASATPTSSETPAVSESPLPSESPAVSESPEPEPEESASPEPSTSPEPEVTPELLPVSE